MKEAGTLLKGPWSSSPLSRLSPVKDDKVPLVVTTMALFAVSTNGDGLIQLEDAREPEGAPTMGIKGP